MYKETKGTRIRGREAKVGRKDADIIWTRPRTQEWEMVETQIVGSGYRGRFQNQKQCKSLMTESVQNQAGPKSMTACALTWVRTEPLSGDLTNLLGKKI